MKFCEKKGQEQKFDILGFQLQSSLGTNKKTLWSRMRQQWQRGGGCSTIITNTWVHWHMKRVSGEEDGTVATNNHTSNTNAGISKQLKPIAPVVLESGCAKTDMVSTWGRQQNSLHNVMINSLSWKSWFFMLGNLDNLHSTNSVTYGHFYIIGILVKFWIL